MTRLEQIDSKFGSTMIIVPHQDDEILMAAGVIYEAVKNQVPIYVVMVTNGDYKSKNFTIGRTRLAETIRGMSLLGLKEEQIIFLGYADTGMPREESFITHLLEEKDEYKTYPSSCSDNTYGLEYKQEYHMIQHQTHAPYCRASLKQDLMEVIQNKKPKNIITTSEYDMHGDHFALYKFVVEVLTDFQDGYKPVLYTGIVHSNAGDEMWPDRKTNVFNCPKDFETATTLKWNDRIIIPVPECMKLKNGKNNLKLQALNEYETALEPGAYEFLMSFIKDEEIFWEMSY